jgi:hypothetical protein
VKALRVKALWRNIAYLLVIAFSMVHTKIPLIYYKNSVKSVYLVKIRLSYQETKTEWLSV